MEGDGIGMGQQAEAHSCVGHGIILFTADVLAGRQSLNTLETTAQHAALFTLLVHRSLTCIQGHQVRKNWQPGTGAAAKAPELSL